MKKFNLTVIATIIATFIFSMFAFQPTTTEASNNALPSATPSPRGIRPKTIQSPITKIKAKKPVLSGVGDLDNQAARRSKQPRRKSAQYNPKEVGIDKIKAKQTTNFTSAEGRSMSFELRTKHPRRKRKN